MKLQVHTHTLNKTFDCKSQKQKSQPVLMGTPSVSSLSDSHIQKKFNERQTNKAGLKAKEKIHFENCCKYFMNAAH